MESVGKESLAEEKNGRVIELDRGDLLYVELTSSLPSSENSTLITNLEILREHYDNDTSKKKQCTWA